MTNISERFKETREKIMKELEKREVCGIFHATRHLDRFQDTLNLLYFDMKTIDPETYTEYRRLLDDLRDYIIDVAVDMDNDIIQLRFDIEYLERKVKDSASDE